MVNENPVLRVHPAGEPKTAFSMVQALRGVAAGMVLLHHAAQTWVSKARGVPFNSEWVRLASGVDIFFVISGFVMAISAAKLRNRPSAGTFMVRRAVRIMPMYWLATLLTVAKIVVDRVPSKTGGFSLTYVACSLLFLPWRPPLGSAAINPILPVGWTLYYEMFFYLLLALVLLLKVEPLRCLAPIMVVLSVAGLFRRDTWPAVTVFFNPLLLEFLAGFCLARAWQYGVRLSAKICIPVLVFGFLCLLSGGDFSGSLRPLLWGLPALLIVGSAVFLEPVANGKVPRFLLRVGDASYSLYLIHQLIIAFLMAVCVHAHRVPTHESTFVLLALLLSTGCALLLYRFVERPLTLLLTASTSRQPSSAT